MGGRVEECEVGRDARYVCSIGDEGPAILTVYLDAEETAVALDLVRMNECQMATVYRDVALDVSADESKARLR
jgi:hypothetical protein